MPSIRASWSVHHSTSTAFVAAWYSWLSIEPLCSLKEEWMCIAMEYADVPSAVTARSGERSGSRGIVRKNAAPAATAAVPCMKPRRDNPGPAASGGPSAAWPGLTAWSSHICTAASSEAGQPDECQPSAP